MSSSLGELGPAALSTAALGPAALWLLGEGAFAAGVAPLLSGAAERLNRDGFSLVHAALVIESLHPLLAGTRFVWRRDTGQCIEEPRFHGFSAMGHGGILPDDIEDRVLRLAITAAAAEGEPRYVGEVRGLNATDLIAFPMAFSDGSRHTVSWATDREAGFTAAQQRTLTDLVPLLGPRLEIATMRQVSRTLLDTYLGKRSGAQVLSGRIRRGDGETIHAVIWLSDLRGFSALADKLSQEELIAALNAHFERLVAPIRAFGGEVLKFMGDGLLAIFPVGPGGDTSGPASAALKAARSAMAGMAQLNRERRKSRLPTLRFGIGLHVGELLWGNIGSPDRLDFTAIGPAVNLASRIEHATKAMRRPLVASGTFAEACPEDMTPLGPRKLRGLKDPVELFTLTELGP